MVISKCVLSFLSLLDILYKKALFFEHNYINDQKEINNFLF